MAYGNYKSFFVSFPNIRILLSSGWTNALAILVRSSLSVLSLWKLRMETELKRVGSIVDRIQVFTLLAKEKVRSAVALDAGLTAKILQILQTLTRNFFSGFSNSLISFKKSRKCSICLSFIKTLNVGSSTFKSLIFTSVAYFSRTISFQPMFPHFSMFWSVGIPNFQTQKMIVFQTDHVQKISRHQRLGKIAFNSDHEDWWGEVLWICFHFLQDNAATSIWVLLASSSRQILRRTQSSEFLLGINRRGCRNFPNCANRIWFQQ